MSRTEKTRPHDVKLAELEKADPYRARRAWGFYYRPEFGCGHTCSCNYGWWKQEKRKTRRQGKAAARNWRKEWE